MGVISQASMVFGQILGDLPVVARHFTNLSHFPAGIDWPYCLQTAIKQACLL